MKVPPVSAVPSNMDRRPQQQNHQSKQHSEFSRLLEQAKKIQRG